MHDYNGEMSTVTAVTFLSVLLLLLNVDFIRIGMDVQWISLGIGSVLNGFH